MFKKLMLGLQELLLEDTLTFLGSLPFDFQLLFLTLQDCPLLDNDQSPRTQYTPGGGHDNRKNKQA